MKRMVCTVAFFATATYLIAGGGGGGGTTAVHDEYCAKMKDGKLTVVYMDKPITADARLNNGATVKMDGTIMYQDGTKATLKDGQCITMDGKLLDKGDIKKHDKIMKEKSGDMKKDGM